MELIASGRDADVFDIGEGAVLRRYTGPHPDSALEAAVMRHLAAHGYPVPAVRSAAGADLVMDRIVGPTMLQSMLAGEISLEETGRVLADLLHRLHQVTAFAGLQPPMRVALQRNGSQPARILHLDLHPDNVLLSEQGPVVIDWTMAAAGPPDLDRAVSAMILAEVAHADGPMADPAGAVLTAFLEHAPVSDDERALALEFRRLNPTLSAGEIARLDGAAALIVV